MTRFDLLYIPHLLACALHDTQPMDKPEGISWETLHSICHRHAITATVYPALTKLAHPPEDLAKWREESQQSLVKQLTFDAARGEIYAKLEEQGINYLPLKGIVLQNYYPKAGMRMFCDNDILVDEHHIEDVQQIMWDLGYDGHSDPTSCHDIYKRAPTLNFEIHKWLTPKTSNFHTYWSDIWQRANHISGHLYTQRDEDYYLFFICHFYKHFITGGCGIRNALDLYILLEKLGDKLDWSYINQELEELGLTQFTREMEALSQTLFHQSAQLVQLDETQWQQYLDLMEAGAYGTQKKVIQRKYAQSGRSKLGYLLWRIPPTYKYSCTHFPITEKYPILFVAGYLPLCIYRLYRGVIHRKHVTAEVKAVVLPKKEY